MNQKDEERLAAFEEMFSSIQSNMDDIIKRMDQLKQQGKKGSATYK